MERYLKIVAIGVSVIAGCYLLEEVVHVTHRARKQYEIIREKVKNIIDEVDAAEKGVMGFHM